MDDIILQALHDFRAYLQRRHYAAHTLASYMLDLQLFFATCPQPLAQVSFRDIERWLLLDSGGVDLTRTYHPIFVAISSCNTFAKIDQLARASVGL